MATSKSTQLLKKKAWVKLLLLLENALKLNIQALQLTETLNPLQAPTHTLTPLSINITKQVKKLRMDLSWHALNFMLQAKTLYHPEKQGFGYPWLPKKFQTHRPKPAEAEPSL